MNSVADTCQEACYAATLSWNGSLPFLYPDPDVPLDLGRAIHQVYLNARYDLQVNYRENPPAPELSPDETLWLNEHLEELRRNQWSVVRIFKPPV